MQKYEIYRQSVLKVYIQAFYTVRKVLYISGDLDQWLGPYCMPLLSLDKRELYTYVVCCIYMYYI